MCRGVTARIACVSPRRWIGSHFRVYAFGSRALVSMEVCFPLVWLLAVPRRLLGIAALVSPPPGTCVQPDPDFGPSLAFSWWCHAWSHRRVFPAVPLWGLALLVSPPASGMQTHLAGEQ